MTKRETEQRVLRYNPQLYENEILLSRKNIDKSSRYIIVIQDEKATEEAEVAWEGKINRIKSHLENALANQNNMVEEIKRTFEKNFKDKISDRWIEVKERLKKKYGVFKEDFAIINSMYDQRFKI